MEWRSAYGQWGSTTNYTECGGAVGAIHRQRKGKTMNHDNSHCADFCVDCPMDCYRAELEVDLRNRWVEFIKVPISYSHFYGTKECKRKDKEI